MLTIRKFLGAFVAVTIGVTVVALSALLFAAGRPHVPDRFAGAAIIVQSPSITSAADQFAPTRPWSSGTAEALAARLSALPAVTAAIPDHTFYAQPLGGDTVEGHGWSSSRFEGGLVAGRPPLAAGEVALDRTPGTRVTVLTATGPNTYTVTGRVDGPELYLADAVAATLAPGVRAIGLLVEAGADVPRVASAAKSIVGDDGVVHTGAARGALEPPEDARTRWIGMQILTGTAALAAFATVFVVAATFAFTVAQRRRELGLLRTIGATPRQVFRMLFGEALTVGAAGSLTGTLLGAALAPALGRVLVAAGAEPATYTVRYTAWPIAAALLLGPLVACLGVGAAARRAARVHPLAAMRDAAVEQRPMGRIRWAVGALITAFGVALAAGTATSGDAQSGGTFALYSAMALVLGAAVLAPAVVPLAARVLTRPARRFRGATAMLVREGALAAPRRTAATAAPVLLTVAFAILVAGLVRTSTEAYAARRATSVDAGWVVAPDGTPGLTDAAVAPVRGTAVLPTTVYTADRPLTALGVDPASFATLQRRLTVVSGSLSSLEGEGTAAVTGQPASDHLEITFSDGARSTLRVVAVIAGGPPGDLLLPREVVRRHDPSALTSAVYATAPVAVPPDTGARLLTIAEYAAGADAAEDRLVWLFTLLLIGVSAGYGAIAVANTQLMAAAGRAPDARVLRLAGATRRQIRRAFAAEAAVVVAIGALLGGAVAGAALLSIRAGLSEQVGAPVPLVVPWPVAAAVVGLCLLLATTAATRPARPPL